MDKKGQTKCYRDSLSGDVRKRYDEKISVIGVDPYRIGHSDCDSDRKTWPEVSIVDVMHYLVFEESSYTKDQLRNYKSLEAYRLFQDGWIRDIVHKQFGEHHLMRAKVCVYYFSVSNDYVMLH